GINENSGLKPKDQIEAIDGKPIKYIDELKNELQLYANQPATISVLREGEKSEIPVTVSENHAIGFAPAFYSYSDLEKAGIYELSNIEYGFFEAFPAGINKAITKLNDYIKQFSLILNPETGAYKGV